MYSVQNGRFDAVDSTSKGSGMTSRFAEGFVTVEGCKYLSLRC